MKRKIFTAIAILLFLTIVQFITYYTIANDKLAEQAINNMDVNPKLTTADTIIFGSVFAVCGNEKESIKPYNLHLTNKDNFNHIKKRFSPAVVIEESEFGAYCDKIIQDAFKKMSTENFENFISNNTPYKAGERLYITASETQKFFVTINYNWSTYFSKEDQYVWIFFSWLKI